jgi:hypothetical protein
MRIFLPNCLCLPILLQLIVSARKLFVSASSFPHRPFRTDTNDAATQFYR